MSWLSGAVSKWHAHKHAELKEAIAQMHEDECREHLFAAVEGAAERSITRMDLYERIKDEKSNTRSAEKNCEFLYEELYKTRKRLEEAQRGLRGLGYSAVALLGFMVVFLIFGRCKCSNE